MDDGSSKCAQQLIFIFLNAWWLFHTVATQSMSYDKIKMEMAPANRVAVFLRKKHTQ